MKENCNLIFIEEILIFNDEIKKRTLNFVNHGVLIESFIDVKVPEGVNIFYRDEIQIDRENISDFKFVSGENGYFFITVDECLSKDCFLVFIDQNRIRHKILLHFFKKTQIAVSEIFIGIALENYGMSISLLNLKEKKIEEIFNSEQYIDFENKDMLSEIVNFLIDKTLEIIGHDQDKVTYIFSIPVFYIKNTSYFEASSIKNCILKALNKNINLKNNVYFLNSSQAISFYFIYKHSLVCNSGDICCLSDNYNNLSDIILMKFREITECVQDKFEILYYTGLYDSCSNIPIDEFLYKFLKWYQIKQNLKEYFLKFCFLTGNNLNIKNSKSELVNKFIEETSPRLTLISIGSAMSCKSLFTDSYKIGWNIEENNLQNDIEILFSIPVFVNNIIIKKIENIKEGYFQIYFFINNEPYRIYRNSISSFCEDIELKFDFSEDCILTLYSTEIYSKIRNKLFEYNFQGSYLLNSEQC